jgi:dihydrofolate reductase
MRKLKLQMQVTADGFVAGPQGQLDWMTFNWDEQLAAFVNQLTDTSDSILLGRKMTPGFVSYWESVITKPESPEYRFGQKMVRTPKVVFSKTLHRLDGQNVRVENGELVDAVGRLKRQPGKDMIVYGGASFVSSLIQHDLIDELNFFINPVAIGEGLRVFHGRKPLALKGSSAYQCGIVVNTYGTK